jgi:hypothetical protein
VEKKNETYYLATETINLVKEYANEHTGNKSKVVEMALKQFLASKDKN